MMKKLFCAILLSFIFFTIAESAIIKIDNFTVSSSQHSITIPVITNCEENFAGVQFSIRYNSRILKVTDIEKGSLISSFTVIPNTKIPGTIKVAGFDSSLTGTSGYGILVNLNFQITGQGTSFLTLRNVKLSDSQGKDIFCNTISGKLTVEVGQNPEETQPVRKNDINQSIPAYSISEASQPETVFEPEELETDVIEIVQISTVRKLPPLTKGDKGGFAQQASNNCVLLIKSEYGNPIPPQGIETFEKGEKVECKVEKEVILNKKEKVICVGYKGEGSVSKGSSNEVSFIINQHSKLIWQWKKVLMKKN